MKVYVYMDEYNVIRFVNDINSLPPTVKENYLECNQNDLNKVVYDETLHRLRLKTEEEYLAEKKQELLKVLTTSTEVYITTYYPELKQRSDLVDQLTNGSLLLMARQDYTSDYIYRQSATAVFLVMDQNVPLSQVLLQYPEDERLRWEQIIKASIRQGFLYRVKWEYWNKKDAINNATTLEELYAIDVHTFQTQMPPGL